MQEIDLNNLEACLSRDRLSVYGRDNPDKRTLIARYLWNIAVSESLCATIHLLEVGLRNAIDRAMTLQTGNSAWYDEVALTDWGATQIKSAKSSIDRRKKEVTPGRVIAELHFGFWTAMFESHFEAASVGFLPGGIKATFPNMPKSLHNRKRIKADLDKVRVLRNRIFHHERVIHWKDLAQQHEMILGFIRWLSHDLYALAKYADRFPDIYAEGIQPYLAKLDA